MKVAEKKPNYFLYGGIALALAGVIYFVKNGKNQTAIDEPISTVDETQPLPIVIDQNKILLRGSRGLEVKELQKLMNITADGIFGIQTETRLLQLKGVKSTSLNSYKNSPGINQNALAIGTKVMANLVSGTPVYKAILKADGTYYSDYSIFRYVDFGKLVGTVLGKNAAGNWYLISGTDLFGDEKPTSRYYVKATDVVKI